MATRQTQRNIAFLRVFAFACAAFIFNTTEFIPVALLSDIADSFAMTTAQTGLMITVYAWVVSLMSLPFMLLTAKMERRGLLMWLFTLFIASHILTIFAWNFGVLLVARIGVALTHSVFWAITASLVIRIAPNDKKQQALALLALGSALAMVLGLPLGRMIGQWLGWRMTFAVIGVVALCIMALMWKLLPHLPSKNAGSIASLPALAKRPMLVGIYLLTMTIVSAHFTGYSYIEPFVLKISQFAPSTTTALLLVFGLSGFMASYLFSKFNAKYPVAFIAVAIAAIALCQGLLAPFHDHAFALFALVFVWGIGIACITMGLQLRVLQLAPDATDVATAIYSGIYNVGIGGGALIGNQVMMHLGLAEIGNIGALLAVCALGGFALLNFFFKAK